MSSNAIRSRVPTELWRRALTDPSLRDLPYKVETNEYGDLVLSSRSVQQSFRKSRTAVLLREIAPAADLQPGEAATEFAVETGGGIKVPDVVWISKQRLASPEADAEASPVMPEIVVGVLSGSNTRAEMEEKRRLYFEAAAREVWVGDPEGRLAFFGAAGETPASELMPSFPGVIA